MRERGVKGKRPPCIMSCNVLHFIKHPTVKKLEMLQADLTGHSDNLVCVGQKPLPHVLGGWRLQKMFIQSLADSEYCPI